MSTLSSIPRVYLVTFGVVFLLVFAQAIIGLPQFSLPEPPPAPESICVGEPINIPFPYEGAPVEPHTCKVQCEDGIRRYIVYTNGKATQCETPPGCNDMGEDDGITCKQSLQPKNTSSQASRGSSE